MTSPAMGAHPATMTRRRRRLRRRRKGRRSLPILNDPDRVDVRRRGVVVGTLYRQQPGAVVVDDHTERSCGGSIASPACGLDTELDDVPNRDARRAHPAPALHNAR